MQNSFEMRVLEIDVEMCDAVEGLDALFPAFSGTRLQRVPVVRLWGATSGGQKVCAHLHKALPYFYLQWPREWTSADQRKYRAQLAISINAVMKENANNQYCTDYVFDIELVQGKQFYGFSGTHSKTELFMRVFLVNPVHVRPIVDLLQVGAIMNTKFQPFEAHIPFRLQVFLDYSIYGMTPVKFSRAQFRGKLPATTSVPWAGGVFVERGLSNRHWTASSSVERSHLPKTTKCELEVDLITDDIVNVGVEEGNLVQSLAMLWDDEQRRCGLSVDDLRQPIQNTQIREPGPSYSAQEQEYRRIVAEKSELEAERMLGRDPSELDTLLSQTPKAKSPYSIRDSQQSPHLRVSESPIFERGQSQAVLSQQFRGADEEALSLFPQGSQEGLDLLLAMLEENEDDGSEELTEEDEALLELPPDEMKEHLSADWLAISQSLQEDDLEVDDNDEPAGFLEPQRSEFKPPVPMRQSTQILEPQTFSQSRELSQLFVSSTGPLGAVSRDPSLEGEKPRVLVPGTPPPTFEYVQSSVQPKALYDFAYVTKDEDLPRSRLPRAVGHPSGHVRVFKKSDQVKPFYDQDILADVGVLDGGLRCLTPVAAPPSLDDVLKYFKDGAPDERQAKYPAAEPVTMSAIDATRPEYKVQSMGSGTDENFNDHLTVMVVEVFPLCAAGQNKEPDPVQDLGGQLVMIAYTIHDEDVAETLGEEYCPLTEIIVVDSGIRSFYPPGIGVASVDTEEEMFRHFFKLVSTFDPDIITGFECYKESLGYFVERGAHLGFDVCSQLARGPSYKNRRGTIGHSHGRTRETGISLTGRVVTSLWQIIRKEVALTSYTYSNCCHHVLHKTVPRFSFQAMCKWWIHPVNGVLGRWKVIEYYVNRCKNVLAMYQKLTIFEKTTESAKIIGIDWFGALTKGSQYRVESVMLRITKLNNFILISPSREQVAQQDAAEWTPCVMEPLSNFYPYPVVVLDFRSLYPSVMIAYNYCYSTCLGRVPPSVGKGEPFSSRLGVWNTCLKPGVLNRIGPENINISPNGFMFVKPTVRHGVLPRMLSEILDTRVMVKGAMKRHKERVGVHRRLNSRQLGLKMIANVTYGYTAASFSGRMPCVHLGDAIVSTGRRALEQAIEVVNGTPKWNARVVYGDTDSLFVLCEGASRERAFEIGEEIAHSVTRINPYPVKLQFEKVYHPCILVAKKRYVGWKFDSPHQKEGVFDAKGIETVRRDNCPLVQKIMKHSLKILFETADLSQIKAYVKKQFSKILAGRIPLKDYIIAKAVRLGTYKAGHHPPGAEVATRMLSRDHRAEPLYAERVPYVVVHDPHGRKRLIDSVRHPAEVLANPNFVISGLSYYIKKQIIPSMNRLFGLMGVDLGLWVSELPRSLRATQRGPIRQGTIDAYYESRYCRICDALKPQVGSCATCEKSPHMAALVSLQREKIQQRRALELIHVCQSCCEERPTSHSADIECSNLDCDVLYERQKVFSQLAVLSQHSLY